MYGYVDLKTLCQYQMLYPRRRCLRGFLCHLLRARDVSTQTQITKFTIMQNDVRDKQYLFSTADQDIFLTSDLHLGHENIIRFCDRPFTNANAMDEALVERWNAVVKDNDIVFVLGDIAFGGAQLYDRYLPRLKGRKYLVYGNHDFKNMRDRYMRYFEQVALKMFISVDGQPIILNHEPLLCFGGQLNNRTWHLFGHVHTNKTGKRGCDSERVRTMCTLTMYDVGVDFNDFTPVRFQDVKAQIARQKKLRMNFVELYEYDHSSRLKQFFLRLRNRLSK